MTPSRDNPSPRYRDLLEQYRALHRDGDPKKGIAAEKMFDGRSLPPQAARIKTLIAKTGAKSLLDYGCGKGSVYAMPRFTDGLVSWNGIREYWGVAQVRCYDPGYQPHSELPVGTFEGVICTDVLEHCPEEDLPWIIAELFGYAERFVYANVACYPAGKVLPNGENAHCTIRPAPFWQALFEAAASRRPGVLWEVWLDTQRGVRAAETRLANFAAQTTPAVSAPLWRLA
jgi:hypothetical protein